MPARSRGRIVVTRSLQTLLAAVFLIIGSSKILGSLHTVEYFAAIGWGQWFRYLTGALDLLGALLLFVPRFCFYGALILVCTVGTATVLALSLLHNNPAVPLVLTVLAATLALLTRSRSASRP